MSVFHKFRNGITSVVHKFWNGIVSAFHKFQDMPHLHALGVCVCVLTSHSHLASYQMLTPIPFPNLQNTDMIPFQNLWNADAMPFVSITELYGLLAIRQKGYSEQFVIAEQWRSPTWNMPFVFANLVRSRPCVHMPIFVQGVRVTASDTVTAFV